MVYGRLKTVRKEDHYVTQTMRNCLITLTVVGTRSPCKTIHSPIRLT